MATMKTKSVGFNVDSPHELELFAWGEAQSNFSQYVKSLMAKDRQKRKNPPSQESEPITIPTIGNMSKTQPSGTGKPLLPGNQQR